MKSKVKTNNKKSLKSVWSRNISGWMLIFPSIFLFVFLVWRPILIGIGYSFFDLRGFEPVEFVGLANYKDVLSDTNFIQTLINTLKYVFWSMVIGFPLPFFTAVMLNEMIHGKSFFKNAMYLPVVVSPIATCMIWKMLYLDGSGGVLNILRSWMGLEPTQWLSNKNLVIPLIVISMTWHGFGSTVIMYLANLQSVNQELYEAARIDGAGAIRRFTTVLFPHMRGILLLLAVKQVIGIFQITEQPLTMTGGGPNGASLSLGLTNYMYAFKYGQYDKSLALGVVTFLILLVLTFIYFGLEKKSEE